MKIAVNTRLLLKDKLEGIGWFSYEILKCLVTQHPEHSFYFIFDRKYSEEFIFSENIIPVVLYPPTRLPFLINYFFQWRIPRLLKKLDADIFISPDGWIPCKKVDVPVLNVIHDINFLHHPEFIPGLYRHHFKKWFPCFAKRADKLVTVSEFSKQDIVESYGVDPDKISVVHNGVSNYFKALDKLIISKTRQKFTAGQPYFIFVGSIHPRKNLENILQAYLQFKEKTKSPVKFVVVGSQMFRTSKQKLSENIHRMKDDILFVGRQDMTGLSQLLGSALALTYASLYEGFGIPILEGFQAGIPVITSNVTSMPEVAGDAAILVNPLLVDEIAEAMTKIWENVELREQLIIKGNERVKAFSWNQSAEKFWQVVESLMD
ncbi:MAG: glycosyltransferase family 4 protein [Bacteroidales bacterium]|nr:glycosyltransferase family 4 protein [Bacteroidales bacterium]